MKRRFVVTSGLPYSNGRLHVGHIAGAYLPADSWVRYLRQRGDEALFVCGSDDNGVASLISSRQEGRSVEELTAHYHARQKLDFAGMGIEFDIYGGTHQPGFVDLHEQLCQSFFRSIHDRGHFVKQATEQLYDPEAKQFLPDRFVRGTCYHTLATGSKCGYPEAYGDQCESCGSAIDALRLIDPRSTITGVRPEPRRTVHWHLRLPEFQEPLARWLQGKRSPTDGPPWRESVLNFALGQIANGLPERAMTRDLTWGVPVPLADPDAQGKVLYVWFDAPIGYASFTAAYCRERGGDWQDYSRYWKDPACRIVHFIGEDNTVFHSLIWPAMLMAEGSFQLPWQVVANSFLNIRIPGRGEEKISKSRGTAVWIEEFLNDHEPDPLRYYLTAIAPESQRAAFDYDEFVRRNDGELLATLGNFIHRVATFVQRNFEGRVPEVGQREPLDLAQLERIGEQHERTTGALEAFRFKMALGEMMALARAGNVYFDQKQPWRQRKEDLAACGTTLNVACQTVKALATLMAPFLPFSAERLRRTLGLTDLAWESALVPLPAGQALGESEVLFRKLGGEDHAGRSAVPPRSES